MESKKILLVSIVVVLVFLAILAFVITQTSNQDQNVVRIGWQIPWATQGQLTQVLKNTDILQKNDINAVFKGFASGAPLNEAALAGNVDIIFTADQPAATLISKDGNWVIIGRLMYNRVSLYVPPKSPITTIADLNGKTVAMPFGAAAQRMALNAEKQAGLDTAKDVKNINLGIYEQSDLVKDVNATKWGEIDAMAGFDPTPAIFEEKGLVRNLKTETVISLILVSKKYIAEHPSIPLKFLKSFREAYDFYRQNPEQANAWFKSEAKLDITSNALSIASAVEPNLKAKSISEIRLSFNDEDYRIMQEAADFLLANKLIQKNVVMRDHVDLSYVNLLQ
ncbi:MAG: ABC transporter substrate-binding protein [archaeon]